MKKLLSLLLAAALAVSAVPAVFAQDTEEPDPHAPLERTFNETYDISPLDAVLRAKDPMDGDGVVIAVIDSGFDIEHPAFTLPEGAAEKLTEEKISAALKGTYAARLSHAADETGYVSPKIPFAYDYADKDFDVRVSADDIHGTHVASTAAGSAAGGFALNGVAPAAQLLLMKVAEDGSGTTLPSRYITQAIYDAVDLGADIISMSLGSVSLTSEILSEQDKLEVAAIRYAVEKGVIVIAAVGNNGISSDSNARYDGLMYASNPDYGTVATPAVLSDVIGVANMQNTVKYTHTFTAGGEAFPYTDANETEAVTAVLPGKTLSYVLVPGIGTEEDFEGLDVAGKIAVITRGEITFAEKARNAEQRGAVAVLILQNEGGNQLTGITVKDGNGDIPSIPVIMITDYEDVQRFLQGKTGKITFKGNENLSALENPTAYAPNDSTGMGGTDDLWFKPDIAFVGTDVVAAKTLDNELSVSGTSMTTPQAAGLAAVLLSRYPDYFAGLTGRKKTAAMRSLMLSLAEPVMNEEVGVYWSPRQQGAGIITNTTDLTPGIFLTVDGSPTLALHDNLPQTFEIPVTVTNMTDRERTLTMTALLSTDGYTQAEDGTYLTTARPVPLPAEVTFDAETLTLAPNAETTVTATVTLDGDFLAANAEIFVNGFYADGYIIASEAGDYAASLPFMGFVGDWNAAPIFEAFNTDEYTSLYDKHYVVITAGDDFGYAGYNYEDKTISAERYAFSPNGDGVGDEVGAVLALLRGVLSYKVETFNEKGEVIYTFYGDELHKSVNSNKKRIYEMCSFWDGSDGIYSSFIWEDGQYTIRITFTGFGGAKQVVEIPMMIDTQKPTVTYTVSEDGTVNVQAADNLGTVLLKALALNPDYNKEDEDSEPYITLAKGEKQEDGSYTMTFDFPADTEYIYIIASDYVGNDNEIRIWG